jgi:membrane protein YdbS with pleckstrin-like domain
MSILSLHRRVGTPSRKSRVLGVLGTLGVLLVALKLTHVIAWPWWVVAAPLWGAGALVLVLVVIAVVATLFARPE